jgi:glutamate--cysteine ligase
LSGAQREHLHQTCQEAGRHLNQAKAVGEKLGLCFLGLGMWPDKSRAELPVMPKGRYAIMLNYMPKVGGLGLDMMLRTCTIQVNLDYSSESDMVRKFRVGLALQPLATALFANSPFTEGRPNGFLSFRSHIWSDTDPDRTGMLPFVFEQGFGYERYLDYALDVPMYFVFRDGKYIDVAGRSFRDFLEGRLVELPGEKPRVTDFTDHLSTIFPEVRLKSFLEMRGGETLQELGKRILTLAEAGLNARGRLNSSGDNESGFLDPLREVLAAGKTPAERLLDRYHGEWGGDIGRIYGEESY